MLPELGAPFCSHVSVLVADLREDGGEGGGGTGRGKGGGGERALPPLGE